MWCLTLFWSVCQPCIYQFQVFYQYQGLINSYLQCCTIFKPFFLLKDIVNDSKWDLELSSQLIPVLWSNPFFFKPWLFGSVLFCAHLLSYMSSENVSNLMQCFWCVALQDGMALTECILNLGVQYFPIVSSFSFAIFVSYIFSSWISKSVVTDSCCLYRIFVRNKFVLDGLGNKNLDRPMSHHGNKQPWFLVTKTQMPHAYFVHLFADQSADNCGKSSSNCPKLVLCQNQCHLQMISKRHLVLLKSSERRVVIPILEWIHFS